MYRRIPILIVLGLGFFPIFQQRAAAADDIRDIVNSTFRNAIVKIEVTSNTPVFQNNINICHSEGTGYFVNSDTIVTAYHVLDIDARCGARVVVAKSTRHKWEQPATLLAQENDIAILKTTSISQSNLCSLLLEMKDAFETEAVRFGIPADLTDPIPSVLQIGNADGQFRPLVLLTPALVKPGESGGPVLHVFNVTGMVKSRHLQTDYGLMIRASTIRQMLKKNNIERDASTCNPVRYQVEPVDNSKYAINFDIKTMLAIQDDTRALISDDLASTSIKLTKIGSPGLSMSQTSTSTIAFENKMPAKHTGKVIADMFNTGQLVSDALVGKWWTDYLAFLKKP